MNSIKLQDTISTYTKFSSISLSNKISEKEIDSTYSSIMGFPGGSDGKASACNAGDLGLIPGSGRSPGEGNGNPLRLENSIDRGPWWATVHGVAKSQTRLKDLNFFSQ